jgi:two-component sensor histidine kinase
MPINLTAEINQLDTEHYLSHLYSGIIFAVFFVKGILARKIPNIIFCIKDDGKGYDIKARLFSALNEKRMGIRSMEQRAKLLQGGMVIQSRPMLGTKISIRLPYKDNNSGSKENHIDNRRPSPF